MNSKNDIANPIQSLQKNAQLGFTLAELMIVVSIIGILAALAGPSFANQLASQRIKSSTNDLTTMMSQARADSIIRREDMIITVIDATNTIRLTSGDGTVLTENTLDEKTTLTLDADASATPVAGEKTINFNASKTASPVVIKVCDSAQPVKCKEITVSVVGNVTVKGVAYS